MSRLYLVITLHLSEMMLWWNTDLFWLFPSTLFGGFPEQIWPTRN